MKPASSSVSQNHVNPAVDFTQIPPGMLALDNMLYFARHHQDAYIRVSLCFTPTRNRSSSAETAFLFSDKTVEIIYVSSPINIIFPISDLWIGVVET